jgi:hypothetical protein
MRDTIPLRGERARSMRDTIPLKGEKESEICVPLSLERVRRRQKYA